MGWCAKRYGSGAVVLGAALLVVLLFASLSAAQSPTLLRWKFKQGDKLTIAVTEDFQVTQRIKDKDVPTTVSQQFDMTWTVRAVDAEGTATIAQRIERIRARLLQSGEDVGGFDSAGSEPPSGVWVALGPVLKSMVGAEFSLKMTAQGEIVELTVPQPTVDAISKLPKLGQLREFFSAEGLKQLMGGSLVVLPAEAVPAGHAWTVTRKARNPLAGPQVVTAAFSYVGPEQRGGKQLQKITVDLDTLPDQAVGINPQAQAAQVKQQDGKGFIFFDNAAGRVLESELRQTMSMTVMFGGTSVDQQVETLLRVSVK
jgi:hypothetical protein